MANGSEKRLPEPVTGIDPGPGAHAEEKHHHEHFNRAIDDAIEQIVNKPWPKPAQYDVTLRFEATIEITNPGGVGQYRVKMS